MHEVLSYDIIEIVIMEYWKQYV